LLSNGKRFRGRLRFWQAKSSNAIAGGAASSADFYIGAHAALAGMKLLTRDPQRYREYFPGLRLIAPR
jgi:predicted nucleic acid-binding protein